MIVLGLVCLLLGYLMSNGIFLWVGAVAFILGLLFLFSGIGGPIDGRWW